MARQTMVSEVVGLPVYDSAARPSPVLDELQQLLRYRHLIKELVSRDIKVRYKRSILGVGWTMLHPLLTMLVLTFVFSNMFRISIQGYAVYVLSGLLVWNFLSTTTLHSMTQLVWGGSLLHRIYLPKAVFAVAAMGMGVVNLLLALIPLGLIMAITGIPFRPALGFLPVSVTLLTMFALGVALFLSTLAARYADVMNMYEVALMAWMYLTPIIYPAEIVPERFRWILDLNPMTYLVGLFRAPIYDGAIPATNSIFIGFVASLTILLVGWLVFSRHADELAYRV